MFGRCPGSRGFALTHLMVTVASVALLAGAAAPLYFRYQGQVLRAEIKQALLAVAAAEAAYFAKHGRYTDDFVQLGWQPEGAPRYLVGFTSDAYPAPSGRNDTSEEFFGSFSTRNMVDAFGLPLSSADLPEAGVSASGFVIGAVGNIDNDPAFDRWTLDESGTFRIVSSDSKD